MPIEIERKFLVKKDRWAQAQKGAGRLYRQGYLLTDPDKTIRVRLSDHSAFITIKGRSVGASRPEYEYAIPVSDAQELLDMFCSAIISKQRYEVYVGGMCWEVDEFLDDNEGLIVAEIELSSEEESFELPDWAGEEVTDQDRYYNSSLSISPYKDWSD